MAISKKMKSKAFAKQGFTLAETLISVGIIGVMATMMIPTILVTSQEKNALIRAKSKTQAFVEAAARLENIDPTLTKPTGQALLELTNYSALKTSGNLITGGNLCSATYPCFIYPDGSTVMSNSSSVSSGDVFTYFNIDPDGNGNEAAITVLYDHDAGRVTTMASAISDGVALNAPGGLNTFAQDPSYASEWSNGH